MITLNRETAYTATLTLASDADQVSSVYQVFATLTHEWGDVVMAEVTATRVSSGIYSVDLTATHLKSAGNHKLHWRYVEGGDTFTKDDFINIYQPYISASDFFNNHPELETEFGDAFKDLERKVHNIIDTHCGQSFEPYYAKTISIDGQDTRQLYFNQRINSLSTVNLVDSQLTTNDTTDYTTYIEVAPENKHVIRWKNPKSTFSSNLYFQVLADWGWQYVPLNITQAADMIIFDLMSDDSIYRQHGIKMYMYDRGSQAQFDTEYIVGSTGNLDADVLLMDYTVFTMSWV